MANEAHFSVVGFVATQPKSGYTKSGTRTLSMRVGWTPRLFDRSANQWTDQPSSFITVQCYRKIAEHGAICIRKGDPIVLKGTLRVREFEDQNGARRSSVEVLADSIGHDLSRGISGFSKFTPQVEQTAAEREHALTAAAERSPLPGDVPPPDSISAEDAARDYPAELDSDDRADPGAAEVQRFDEDEARELLDEAAEPSDAVV
jgi:single-stranded DNA-binding protein